jgi:enamine deaminase RidA (YjgF/YER057c/UK114 family)
LITGRVGDDVSVEDAKAAARLIGLNLVSTMRHATGGDLDKVRRVVKLVGFVRCHDKFVEQPQVINGCSDLMVEIFGPEKGKHARSAVGTNALPLGVAVEIEAIVELEP